MSDYLTPAQRLQLLEDLTREAWMLSGRPIPGYSRSEIPVVLRRLNDASE
jgi:hypothetical protein